MLDFTSSIRREPRMMDIAIDVRRLAGISLASRRRTPGSRIIARMLPPRLMLCSRTHAEP
jgi:hypothetical protein